ncbi:MAG: N-6 DNA methylase [Candidatus Bathyarchaeota archaeon]|nr:N-6 DNA methylase [Candidatus Bathyarchaeota archaeon]
MSNVALKKFVNNVCNLYFSGKATEGSYYSVLKSSFEEYAKAKGIDAEIIVQPKRSEGGMPDMLLRSNGSIIGHIEVKDIPQNLVEIERTKQLKQYKQAYPNLILTDLFSFVLFREGSRKANVVLADKHSLLLSNTVPKLSHIQEVESLLDEFLSYGTPETFTARELATELAKRAKQLKNNVIMELENNKQQLLRVYESIKKQLLPSLTKEYFADMYAQTLTYGLFFARIQAGSNEFNRVNAYSYIPNNIPLLERLFYLMQDPRLIEHIKWILDDIVAVLNKSDIPSVVKNLHTLSWSEDPVIHFYETFLKVYNPKERQHLGVYYTPAPIVAYIMSSVHEFLVSKFKKVDGLADKSVTLLDPASGTLTFPIMGIKLCHSIYEKQGKAGSFPSLVEDHILKNFYAFELLLAPYVIGHFKATLALQDLGCSLKNRRFQLYLTNALEFERSSSQDTIFPEINSEEKNAIKVKEEPVFVVVGNPPYSVSSENKSKFIETLMDDYKVNLENERNIQPLSDDYIKFLRLANWKIAEKSNQGIVGMITNNAYLDGLIHRSIRKKLLDDFNEIYILNLHGNSRSQEKTPEGNKDENVFEIQQGVSIIFLLKNQENTKSVYYKDMWGTRESKYQWLLSHSASETDWIELRPASPDYWFIPNSSLGKYAEFPLLTDLMPFQRQGVKTHRDWLVVGLKTNELSAKLNSLKTYSEDEFMLSMHLREKDRPGVVHSKRLLSNITIDDNKIIKYSYRPFDERYLYYDYNLLDRPRPELFKHLGSLFLVTRNNSRQWPGIWSFAHVTSELPDIDMRGERMRFLCL